MMQVGIDTLVAAFPDAAARTFTAIGKERGSPPVTRAGFDAQSGPTEALLAGNPEEEVAAKILRHSDALGGISRVTFQIDTADLPHETRMRSIELLGTRVAPLLRRRERRPGIEPGRRSDATPEWWSATYAVAVIAAAFSRSSWKRMVLR